VSDEANMIHSTQARNRSVLNFIKFEIIPWTIAGNLQVESKVVDLFGRQVVLIWRYFESSSTFEDPFLCSFPKSLTHRKEREIGNNFRMCM
jgi:hypothetical protein